MRSLISYLPWLYSSDVTKHRYSSIFDQKKIFEYIYTFFPIGTKRYGRLNRWLAHEACLTKLIYKNGVF